jgi:hypothetical protein
MDLSGLSSGSLADLCDESFGSIIGKEVLEYQQVSDY